MGILAYLAEDDEDLELGESPTQAHTPAVAEGQRGEGMTRLQSVGGRRLQPALGQEALASREVALAVADHVVLEHHVHLPTHTRRVVVAPSFEYII